MAGAEASKACAGRADAVRLFVLEAPMNMCLLDGEARFLAASPSFLANCRVTLADIAGSRLFDFLPGSEHGIREARTALAAGAQQHAQVRDTVLPDGRVQWFKTETSHWRNDAGDVGGFLLVNQDVTAEHQAEAARREMEILLQAVVDNIPATLSVQDMDTMAFALVNSRACDVLEMTPEAVLGKRPEDLLSTRRRELVDEAVAELVEGPEPSIREMAITSGPYGGHTIRMKRLTFEDARGRKRMLSVGEDITDLRAASQALEAALAEAEAANQAKSRFLANVSHEIRTPLNGVLGMAQAMARDELPERQRERLGVVRQSGESLLAILNDLLDLAKIEAGKLELEALEFPLDEVVRATCANFRALADEKGLGFRLDMKAEPDACRGDPTRLRQVLSNLISNALKFTESGHVAVAVRRRGDMVEFTVRDTGVGMPEQTVERMFDKFSQADVSTTRRFGGTGLGLSICRDLVELMGGRIAATSQVGAGSAFVFTVPLPVCTATLRDEATPVATREERLRVLAAEDNAVNRMVLLALLEQLPIDLTVVENGAEAVEAWAAGAWDVLLMDVQMPVLDGPGATRAIRQREAVEGRPRTPIIALTADAMAHHAAEHLASGMDATVAKPVQLQALVEALDAVLVDEPARQVG